MTLEQIKDAVKQARSHCELKEVLYNNKQGEYESFSLREVLITLGFSNDEASEVIQYCADNGFNYCIDPMIANPGTYPDFKDGEFPPYFACVWGVDQLRSRLWCVR